MIKERLIIEGAEPEKALFRLQKAGISIYRAKKIKKNQILFTVSKKDSEKVFAIYPKMWYNIYEGSAYFCKKVGADGIFSLWEKAKNRVGILLGIILFASVTLCSEHFVLSFAFTGAKGYETAVLSVFERYGVKRYAPYPKGRENELCAELMKLPQITFASVKKCGTVVTVDLRASAFSHETLQSGAFVSSKDGILTALTVLRGTALKSVGQSVRAGEVLVGNYLLKESGEKVPVYASAKATISCLFEGEIIAETEQDALFIALPKDCEQQSATLEKTENGFFVRLQYEYTETFNF